MGLFSVFSTNTPFQVQKGYSPSAVFTILEHNGNYKKSAVALLEAGYGERKSYFGDKLEREVFEKR